MKYSWLSHHDVPSENRFYTHMEFFLPEREKPVAIIRHTTFTKTRVVITSFWTINGNGTKTALHNEVLEKIDSPDYWKKLYPWLWTECLRSFIQDIRANNPAIENVELESAWNALHFYRKAANALLESGDIESWKQGNKASYVKRIPSALLPIVCPLLPRNSNIDHFTFYLGAK